MKSVYSDLFRFKHGNFNFLLPRNKTINPKNTRSLHVLRNNYYSAMMGRTKKTPQDYASENENLAVESDTLFCKYCRNEINIKSKGSDRIREHLASKRHRRIKLKCLEESRNQPTINESLFATRKRKQESEDVAHEFVRAVCYSGLPFSVMNGPVAHLVKRFCPAARTMPGVDALAGPYLDRVFDLHTEQITTKVSGEPLTIIVDESPELMGRPCVNTLFSFYDKERRDKAVLLVNCSFLNVCNAATILLHITNVLETYHVDWKQVIGLASDSAAYIRSLYTDLRQSHNSAMVHIASPAHLINVSVCTALESPSFSGIHKVVVHMASLFKHAVNIRRKYLEISGDSSDVRQKIPPTVVPTRWFSWYESALVVLEMWPQLLSLVYHCQIGSAKARKQAERLGDQSKRQRLYVLLKFVVSVLQQIHSIQKVVEGDGALIHKIDHLLNVQLAAVVSSVPQTSSDLPQDVSSLLCMLTLPASVACFQDCQSFYTTFNAKWSATVSRNISSDTKSLWLRSRSFSKESSVARVQPLQ